MALAFFFFFSLVVASHFEEGNIDYFRNSMGLDKTLHDKGIHERHMHEGMLVDGLTRILEAQRLIQESFNCNETSRFINPAEAVAYGAAV